jgi:hypothetical protein
MTPKETSQLPLAGIFAPDNVTLLDVLLSDNAAPPQVLVGVCWPNARLAGKDTVIPDWVSANPLVLLKLTTNSAATFTATLAGENAALTVGDAGVTVMGLRHALALVPAEAGAVVPALPAVKFTTAVSVLPAESVTTRLSVPMPLAVIFTWALVAPLLTMTAPLFDHA